MDFKSVLSKPKEQLSPHNSTGKDDLNTNCKVDILLQKIFGDVSMTKKVTALPYDNGQQTSILGWQ